MSEHRRGVDDHGGRPSPARPLQVCLDASAVPDHPTGAGRYVLELSTRLSERSDLDLTLVCRRGDGARWEATGAAMVVDRAPPARPLRLAWEQVELPRILEDVGPHVLHSPHYTMPLRADIPQVVTIHDMTFFEHPEWHERTKVLFFRRAIRLAASRAHALVTPSSAAAERIRQLLELNGVLHLIPHGVDHDRFFPLDPADQEASDRDEAARVRMGIRPPYAAFIGTLEPRKDVPSLVRAFDSIARDVPKLQLVLAGAPGWGMEAIEAAIGSSTHRDRVRRVGYISEEDKVALLRGAAVVAYPSREEGFGLPVLEALACGAPLVTTSGSAMAEVVEDAACLVPPADTTALAVALQTIVQDGSDVDDRRRKGLALAARYTWQASADAHVRVYRSLLPTG